MNDEMTEKRNALFKEYEEKYPDFKLGRKYIRRLTVGIIAARTISAVISISCFMIRGFPVQISHWIFIWSVLGSFLVVLTSFNTRIAFFFYILSCNGFVSLFIIFDDVKKLVSTGGMLINIMTVFYLSAVIFETVAVIMLITNYKCIVYFNLLPDIKEELKKQTGKRSLKNMKKLPVFLAVLFVFIVMLGLVRLKEGSGIFQFGKNQETDADAVQHDWESAAVRTEEDTTYRNTYLGFSYTIPKGWWLYVINDDNFNPDPLYTGSSEILTIKYGTDAGFDYSYIELASFANLRDSSRDNHIGFLYLRGNSGRRQFPW